MEKIFLTEDIYLLYTVKKSLKKRKLTKTKSTSLRSQHVFFMYESRVTFSAGKEKVKRAEEKYAPVFNVPLRDRRLKLDSSGTMTLECFVDAKPYADISWFVS